MLDKLDNKKKMNLFIIATIVIVIIAFILFSPSGVINRVILNDKKYELNELIDREIHIKDSLVRTINKLRDDTLEIERLAREKYGMKRPGEKIYLVPKNKELP